MSIPNYPDKDKGTPILKPEHMLEYRRRAGMLPMGDGPGAVILCLQRGLPERAKRRHPYRQVGRMNGDLFSLNEAKGKAMVLTNFGLGSPQMAGLAEELIAWGARKLISISMAGGIHPSVKSGDVVVCNRAIRDEGTSYHYLPAAKFVDGDTDLAEQLRSNLESSGVSAQLGTTWTTDATFRETDLEVKQYQSEGVLTVEMETAALFAVAQVRGVKASSAFVAGDSLAAGTWQAPTDMRKLHGVFERVYDAVIETLRD